MIISYKGAVTPAKKIVKVSCQVSCQETFMILQENCQETCMNLQETCRFVQETCRFVQETCQDVNDMYVYCTVLYCVRYVYALVHIRLRHVIGGGNFWKFHKSAGNSIKSAGNLTRNLYE